MQGKTTYEHTFIDAQGRAEKAFRRTNPDGSLGGWVAESANLDPTVIVERGAEVGPGIVIGPNQVVPRGSFINRAP